MYGEFDAVGKAIVRLHSPDFNIDNKVQLSEQLVLHSTRTITSRLRLQITNGFKRTSFCAYVQQSRQCDLDLCRLDQECKTLRRD